MNQRLAIPVIVVILLLQLGFASVGSARGQQICQPNDFSVSMRASDGLPYGFPLDDFRPLGTTISTVTVWGAYLTWNEQGDVVACGGPVFDDFSVAVSAQSTSTPTPGGSVGSSNATILSKIEVPPQGGWVGGPLKLWRFDLQLDTPITGLDDSGASTYWINVFNATSHPFQFPCYWHWLNTDTVYNQHSIADGISNQNPLAARTKDFAFCLDIEFESPPTPVAPCCDCSGGCEVATQLACESNGRLWKPGEPACTPGLCPAGPPPNDTCALAASLPLGGPRILIANNCATTDGPSPVPTENGPAAVEGDLWYTVFANVGHGSFRVELCLTGLPGDGVMDPVLSIYHDPENPTECVCPDEENPDAFLWPAGQSSDDDCTDTVPPTPLQRGPGSLSGLHCGDSCFVIRVSGASGRPGNIGEARLGYSIIIAPEPYPPFVGDSVCQGGSSVGSPCGTNADCPGGTCHSRSRYLSIKPGGDTPCSDIPDGEPVAIQVWVAAAPNAGMVGDMWWAGADQSYSDLAGGTFRAAPLVCSETATTISSWEVGEPLYLYGPAIVPGATYEVRRCADLAGEFCSWPTMIQTGSWGDIVPPLGTPNFADISACVGTFAGAGNAPSRTRSKLQPAMIDPSVAVSFADISAAVGAFMGQSYPFAFGQCP